MSAFENGSAVFADGAVFDQVESLPLAGGNMIGNLSDVDEDAAHSMAGLRYKNRFLSSLELCSEFYPHIWTILVLHPVR